MAKYEVLAGRFDIPMRVIASFEAVNDEEAKIRFDQGFVKNPNYDWDNLRLSEVVQERKTRSVETSDSDTRKKSS